jgi:hypothetical protein
MLAHIRRIAGVTVAIVLITHTVMSISATIEPTPAEAVTNTIEFYAAAAASWMNLLYLLCVGVWIFGGFAHAVALTATARPNRPLAAVSFAGSVGVFWIGIASALGRTSLHMSESSGSPPAWVVLAALFLPPAVQVLDLLLPPWRSAQPEHRTGNVPA